MNNIHMKFVVSSLQIWRKLEDENNCLKTKFKYGIENLLKINIKQSTNPSITKTRTEKLPSCERYIRPERGREGRRLQKKDLNFLPVGSLILWKEFPLL